MARYRKIDVRLWGDDRFQALSGLEPSGKALWLYLLTSPNTNSIPGLFRAGEAAMAEELGWPLKAFREAFGEVIAQGLAKADWKTRIVWIPKAQKYNRPESINVVVAWRVSWDELPECPLKVEAHQSLKALTDGMGEGFALAFAKACPMAKALPRAIQEQEQEPEQETPLPPSGAVSVRVAEEEFSKLWATCLKKNGPGDARKAYVKHRRAGGMPPLQAVMDSFAALQKDPAWAKEKRRYQPHMATWLNREGWDEVPSQSTVEPEFIPRYHLPVPPPSEDGY